MPNNKKSYNKEKTDAKNLAEEKRKEELRKQAEIINAEFQGCDDEPPFDDGIERCGRVARVESSMKNSEPSFDDEGFGDYQEEKQESATFNKNKFKLFDIEKVKNRFEHRVGSHQKRDKELKKVLEHSGYVEQRVLPDDYNKIMDDMDASYPHFNNVTEYLRLHMNLSSLKDVPVLSFGTNLLLNGPAGVGKSAYLFELSEKFNTSFCSIDCATASNGMDLVGSSASWGTGQAGMLYDVLFNQECPNPIIMLDEVEKSQADSNHPFANTLFALLEKNNAKTFTDEFVQVPMDASLVNWVATSNDANLLKGPVLDRFKVLQVNAPSVQGLKTIIPNLYKKIVQRHGLGNVFTLTLDDEVIDKLTLLSGVSLRLINSALEDALAGAGQRYKNSASKNKRRVSIKVSDIPILKRNQESNPIGFIWG